MMRFLRRLLLRCMRWLQRKRVQGLNKASPPIQFIPYVLAPDERVARFIYSERKIRKTRHRPKPDVFDPSPYMELSTVHSSGLTDEDVWAIGRQTLRSEPGRNTIYARADVPVQSLLDVRLRALRDDKPFQRHTSVIDWPIGSDANETKELWKLITLQLSEDSRITLVLPGVPIAR